MLALMRHEQPPPGYFDRFPREVIARIHESESAAGLSLFQSPEPWFQRLWNTLAARAVFPTAFSAAVCSVLVMGLTRSTVGQAAALSITDRVDSVLYAEDTRPTKMPLIEHATPEPSMAGVVAARAPAGILCELRASGVPGIAVLPPLSPTPAK